MADGYIYRRFLADLSLSFLKVHFFESPEDQTNCRVDN